MCEKQSIYNFNLYTKKIEKCKKENYNLINCIDNYNGIQYCVKYYLNLMKCIENNSIKV